MKQSGICILNNIPSEVQKYLEKFSSDKWKLKIETKKHYDMILVIPVLAEQENLKSLIESLVLGENKYYNRTLILFVINNLITADKSVKRENENTAEYIERLIAGKDFLPLSGKLNNSVPDLNYVDAFSESNELPEKDGGVGLARKIGMDLALKYFNYNSPTKKILVCTDGDCVFSQNYISAIFDFFNDTKKDIKAAHLSYEHPVEGNEETKLAIICYEIFLRYYVLGLKYSQSPFAFHTIGSTMVCDYESYIKIQGMNKKKAAEDFYFLEKLAKITDIHCIDSAKVYPQGRGSWRVPFGTGQRINRYKAKTHEEYKLYSPLCFSVLKQWLEVFQNKNLSGEDFLQEAESINPSLGKFLNDQNFAEEWNKILSNTKSESQINKQKKMWFDGFRTLKLIHFLRDEVYGVTDMFPALDLLFDEMNIDGPVRTLSIPDLPTQMQYLEILRENT